MKRYVFAEKGLPNRLCISFLCGAKYNEKNAADKRNVLKAHIESLNPANHVIILEQNFDFASSNKALLKYDDIFLRNLRDVETLTALYSDCEFIIHESLSTAAELGLFSTDSAIRQKLCLLVPDKYAVEEEKISSFIRLAFFRNSSDIVQIPFYPAVETWRKSEYKSDYRTTFAKNVIGPFASRSIMGFIASKEQQKIQIRLQRGQYGNGTLDMNTISYVMRGESSVDIQVPPVILRTQIMSLFNIRGFQNELRNSKRLDQHVTFIENWYNEMMKNTVANKEGRNIGSISITIKGSDIKLRVALAYVVYLLQAMRCVTLRQSPVNENERIFEVGPRIAKVISQYAAFVSICEPSRFSRMMS